MDSAFNLVQTLASIFVFVIGAILLVIAVTLVIDITKTTHTVRRNLPVIGRFRYVFERMGEFLRQYFYALDREELPFNRAQRSWVYRASKGVDSTVAPDLMRCKHLGSDAYFYGSVLELPVKHILPNRAADNCEQYWQDITAEYKVIRAPPFVQQSLQC